MTIHPSSNEIIIIEGKETIVKMERSKVGTAKRCPDDLTIAQAFRPPGVATPRRTVDELTNEHKI